VQLFLALDVCLVSESSNITTPLKCFNKDYLALFVG